MPDITGRNRKGQFKAGSSGNPLGRPKDKMSITRMLKSKLDEVSMEKVIVALIDKACEGNLKAIDLIFTRAEGRVNLMQDLNDDGLPKGFETIHIGMICDKCREVGEIVPDDKEKDEDLSMF
tara:strand:- start:49 stop:414 length:366 start_codon:yes stop_codon:yes gene_type:complete